MRHRLKTAGILVAMLIGAGTAAAQDASVEEQGEALGACMVKHHTEEHANQVKTMLIDALNDDTAALDKSALAMGMGAIMIATQHCGLAMTDLESPKFGKAAEVYGKEIVTKILGTAMAKIGVD